MAGHNDDFIMLPTVDFCFKELMQNPKVRKGFIAALLNVSPEEIRETKLLPTILRQETAADKFGILDVRVLLEDGTQMDMEMQVAYYECWAGRSLYYLGKMYTEQLHKGEPYSKLKKCIHVSILDFIYFEEDEECYRKIHFRDDKTGTVYTDLFELQILELEKLPREVRMRSGEDVVNWMQFFNGKSRKEFEHMVQGKEYLEEAYNTLKEISMDDQKRLEYEARERALKDYNTQMSSAEERGLKQGLEQGVERINRLNRRLAEQNRTEDMVRASQDREYQDKLLREFGI